MKNKLYSNEEIIRIIKYVISAGTSFGLDLLLFTIFNYLLTRNSIKETQAIFIATAIARIISSTYNYLVNSRLVFKDKSKKGMIGYFLLVVIQMIASATLVSIIKKIIPLYATIIKTFVDIIIFIINYIIQKKIIFKEKN